MSLSGTGIELVPLQVTVTEFQIIVAILLTAGGAFSGWLYRHERWFRNIVFPVIQTLTGRSPRGDDIAPSRDGVIEETDDRLSGIEDDVDDLKEQVEELQKRQDRHNEKTEGYLRRVVAKVEGISLDDVDEPLFRGDGGDEKPRPDGGQETRD
jgi:hypothetical protein